MGPCRIIPTFGSEVSEGFVDYSMKSLEREREFLPNGSKERKENLCGSPWWMELHVSTCGP
jgi:hypothetical protein